MKNTNILSSNTSTYYTMDRHIFDTFAQKVRAGDEEAFNAFLLIQYEKCTTGLRSLIASEEERHDVFLDAIYKFRKDYIVDQRLTMNEKSFNVSGCIYRIARNMWLAAKRKEQTRRKYNDEFKNLELKRERIDNGEERVLRENLEKNEALLHQAIDLLDEKCKELIKKRWFEGFKLKDLYKSLNFTEGYIRIKHPLCQKKLYKLFVRLKKDT